MFLTLVRERSGNSQAILIDILSINPDCVTNSMVTQYYSVLRQTIFADIHLVYFIDVQLMLIIIVFCCTSCYA